MTPLVRSGRVMSAPSIVSGGSGATSGYRGEGEREPIHFHPARSWPKLGMDGLRESGRIAPGLLDGHSGRGLSCEAGSADSLWPHGKQRVHHSAKDPALVLSKTLRLAKHRGNLYVGVAGVDIFADEIAHRHIEVLRQLGDEPERRVDRPAPLPRAPRRASSRLRASRRNARPARALPDQRLRVPRGEHAARRPDGGAGHAPDGPAGSDDRRRNR